MLIVHLEDTVVRNKGFRGWRKFWKILRRFNIFETWKSSKIFGKIPRKLEKYWWDLKIHIIPKYSPKIRCLGKITFSNYVLSIKNEEEENWQKGTWAICRLSLVMVRPQGPDRFPWINFVICIFSGWSKGGFLAHFQICAVFPNSRWHLLVTFLFSPRLSFQGW